MFFVTVYHYDISLGFSTPVFSWPLSSFPIVARFVPTKRQLCNWLGVTTVLDWILPHKGLITAFIMCVTNLLSLARARASLSFSRRSSRLLCLPSRVINNGCVCYSSFCLCFPWQTVRTAVPFERAKATKFTSIIGPFLLRYPARYSFADGVYNISPYSTRPIYNMVPT